MPGIFSWLVLILTKHHSDVTRILPYVCHNYKPHAILCFKLLECQLLEWACCRILWAQIPCWLIHVHSFIGTLYSHPNPTEPLLWVDMRGVLHECAAKKEKKRKRELGDSWNYASNTCNQEWCSIQWIQSAKWVL